MKGIREKKADRTYFIGDDGIEPIGNLEIHDPGTDCSRLDFRGQRHESGVMGVNFDIFANTKKGASEVSEFLRYIAGVVDEHAAKLRDE